MRNKILTITAILLMFQLFSCMMAEMASEAKQYNLILENASEIGIKMFVAKGAGEFEEVIPSGNVYSVNIPSMRGGYSKFLGIKFNSSNPNDYEILQIKKEDNLLIEYSINEIEKSEKDSFGNYILSY